MLLTFFFFDLLPFDSYLFDIFVVLTFNRFNFLPSDLCLLPFNRFDFYPFDFYRFEFCLMTFCHGIGLKLIVPPLDPLVRLGT